MEHEEIKERRRIQMNQASRALKIGRNLGKTRDEGRQLEKSSLTFRTLQVPHQ